MAVVLTDISEDDYRLSSVERAAIVRALRASAGIKRQAAKMMGIGKTTLYRKISCYDITESEYATGTDAPPVLT